MDKTLASVLDTIQMLGQKEQRSKEETLTYNELLRYTGALVRYNTTVVNHEIRRVEDSEEMRHGQAGRHSANMP